jgi:hypothetical protein
MRRGLSQINMLQILGVALVMTDNTILDRSSSHPSKSIRRSAKGMYPLPFFDFTVICSVSSLLSSALPLSVFLSLHVAASANEVDCQKLSLTSID